MKKPKTAHDKIGSKLTHKYENGTCVVCGVSTRRISDSLYGGSRRIYSKDGFKTISLRAIPCDFEKNFMSFVMPEPNTGCWLWAGASHYKGYGILMADGKGDKAHRVSYKLYKGAIPNGMMVCHHCDVPACVNPDHLFVGSASDNAIDMVRKGRQNIKPLIGYDHPSAKICDADVYLIRFSGISDSELSEILSIHEYHVSKIRRNLSWKHLPHSEYKLVKP